MDRPNASRHCLVGNSRISLWTGRISRISRIDPIENLRHYLNRYLPARRAVEKLCLLREVPSACGATPNAVKHFCWVNGIRGEIPNHKKQIPNK